MKEFLSYAIQEFVSITLWYLFMLAVLAFCLWILIRLLKGCQRHNEADNALQQKAVRQTKNKQLFSLLPQEFSTQDVVNLRLQNGYSSGACYMVTKRWVDEGLVQRVSQGRFVKIKQVG